MGELTRSTPTSQPAQLQSAGGSSLMPPDFKLGASPLGEENMCKVPTEQQDHAKLEEEKGMCLVDPNAVMNFAAPTPDLLNAKQEAAAIAKNDAFQFRIDWVRNLQLSLLGRRVSTNGNFDQATVEAIANYQSTTMGLKKPNGIIDSATRKSLETTYPTLLSKIVGSNTDMRVLVPAAATGAARYGYWKSVVEEAGGVFNADPMAMNIVGIRGVKIADGTETFDVGGKKLQKGDIYQTTSAKDFVDARAAGKKDDHLSGDHTGFDDLMVSLWVDDKAAKFVKERIGNVDPNELYKDDEYKTGHLQDGQYAYELGTHGTKSKSHKDAVNGISDPDNALGRKTVDGKLRYSALRPTRNQEVWREHESNDLAVSENEEATSRQRIYDRNSRYVNSNFAMNIHSSSNAHPNSQACMNVPADQYLDFIKEVQGSSNTKNILFTLIDASKVNLTVTKTDVK